MNHFKMEHFKMTIKMTANTSTVQVNMPLHIVQDKTRWTVMGVAGKLTTSALVHIHSPTLATNRIYTSPSGKTDLIATAVVSSSESYSNLENSRLSFPLSTTLQHNPTFDFYLTDSSYNLLSMTGTNFVEVTIGVMTYLD